MSLRKAINHKCKECLYDPVGKGTWREQVAVCTSWDCPLWNARPKPTKASISRLISVMEEQGLGEVAVNRLIAELDRKNGQNGAFVDQSVDGGSK